MGALRRERHDWRTVKLEKRVRKMKEKGLEKGKIGEALQGDRQLTPGGGGVTVQEKSDFLLVL